MSTIASTDRTGHTFTGAPIAPEQLDVVVIGGGQAGLATGYYLARKGLRFVILDNHDHIGDVWRRRWDSLTLFTPARVSGLPGMRFPAPPNSYPTKDQVADYFESYASAMHLPVRTSVEAKKVSRSTGGRWIVETTGPTLEADSVVIATGSYQSPATPPLASELDPTILQMHAADYRNPSQLKPGSVLVVGASLSGVEIATEAARQHATILAGRDTGRMPIRPGQGIAKFALPLFWFVLNRILTVDTPMGRKVMPTVRSHGVPLHRSWRSAMTEAGVERIATRITGTRDGKPMLADGRVLDVRNVVWCTGFHGDYSWVDGLTYGDDGYPVEDHGVVTSAPGLYFVGLKFQRSFASALVGGVGRDAKFIVDRIASRVPQTA